MFQDMLVALVECHAFSARRIRFMYNFYISNAVCFKAQCELQAQLQVTVEILILHEFYAK